jgi:glucose-1-phosphate cytidylyltransferase
MKVVIFAGGLGSRLSEETYAKPKPMIKISNEPILWHIMKIYSHFGLNEFIVLGGYKYKLIENYFKSKSHKIKKIILKKKKFLQYLVNKEKWKVIVLNTGLNTMTGGRLKKIKFFLRNDENFCLTYGDGLAYINIKNLIKKHIKSKCLATITAVQPPARFGSLSIKNNKVTKFSEKMQNSNNWINGGYFVLSAKVLKLIRNNKTIWEKEPLEILAKKKQLVAYKHRKFWLPMDTLKDKKIIQRLWSSGRSPWKVW